MPQQAEAQEIYTIGHSTRTLEQLLALLRPAGVCELVDVRSVPRSRRHPQFDAAALTRSLPGAGIAYEHESALGGFRRPAPASLNGGWQHPAFRGYADHMASREFRESLERVAQRARLRTTCLMCAEAQWWRCHRRLLSDALLVRGWRVLHLGLGTEPVEHELTPFALAGAEGQLTYPPAQTELAVGA
jgi:uncharacterized protein (DUF488 family)